MVHMSGEKKIETSFFYLQIFYIFEGKKQTNAHKIKKKS